MFLKYETRVSQVFFFLSFFLTTSIRKTSRMTEVLSLSCEQADQGPAIWPGQHAGFWGQVPPQASWDPWSKDTKHEVRAPITGTQGLMHTHVDTLRRVFGAHTGVFTFVPWDVHTYILTQHSPRVQTCQELGAYTYTPQAESFPS